MSKRPVLLSHDGGLDDYLSLMLLLTMENVDVLGVVITPADCYIEPAVSATRKILDLMERPDIPVAASTVRGLNPFPTEFRKTSYQIDNLPILNTKEEIRTRLVEENGQTFMARLLQEAPQPVVLLEVGPLTTLVEALKIDPQIKSKIDTLLWMGGALNVPGNVVPYLCPDADGTAEFNVYWDPMAATEIWQSDIATVICPLDITDTVPLTAQFMAQLGHQHHYPISDLAGQGYALVRHQPYFFWDVLTTAYLARPDLYHTRDWETAITLSGPSQGRTKLEPGGKKVTALDKVDVQGFYDYILGQWRR